MRIVELISNIALAYPVLFFIMVLLGSLIPLLLTIILIVQLNFPSEKRYEIFKKHEVGIGIAFGIFLILIGPEIESRGNIVMTGYWGKAFLFGYMSFYKAIITLLVWKILFDKLREARVTGND